MHDAPRPIASASRLARKMEAIFNCSPAAFARLAAASVRAPLHFVAGKSVQVSGRHTGSRRACVRSLWVVAKMSDRCAGK